MERLQRIIKSHPLPYKMALYIVRIPAVHRIYHRLRVEREFHSRIKQINPSEYLDISHKPNLNVILIVVDCLRNSHLSSQGYFRETTPFLDSIKSRFSAISASSWTYPSVASILTGLYPHNHNATLSGKTKDLSNYASYKKLRDDIPTVPEMLFFLDYRIFFGTAIAPAYWAIAKRAVPKEYDASTAAEVMLNDLTKWISKEKDRKFFAYIQLGDLHPPLNPPDAYKDYFGNVKDLPNINFWDFWRPEHRKKDGDKFLEYKKNRELLYDNLLRYTDYEIERFYRRLEGMGLAESTIFIVTGDHGEQFWEHAELDAANFYLPRDVCGISHGDNFYNEVIEVPLLLSGPVPERKTDNFVSTVDIVPTIIDLLGISHNMTFDGRNIFETEGERPLLSEGVSCGYEKKALIIGKYKLIYAKDDGIEWVFDLEKDPQEQHPIMDKEVTSVFVGKLLEILRDDEKRKIREIAGKTSL